MKVENDGPEKFFILLLPSVQCLLLGLIDWMGSFYYNISNFGDVGDDILLSSSLALEVCEEFLSFLKAFS